jgi:hypothetical protein
MILLLHIVKDACELPADVGECHNYIANWYYDIKIKRCRQFYYGGCGGNENNFRSEQDCEQRCKKPEEEKPVPRPTPEARPQPTEAAPTPIREPVTTARPVVDSRFQGKTREDCLLPYDAGSGEEEIVRYYYNSHYGVCSYFLYKGHDGNENGFETLEDCDAFCKDAQDTCKLLPYYGRCDRENTTKWYYDHYEQDCKEFVYGGCEGNKNNFDDRRSCERACGTRRPEPEPEPETQRPETRPRPQVCVKYNFL